MGTSRAILIEPLERRALLAVGVVPGLTGSAEPLWVDGDVVYFTQTISSVLNPYQSSSTLWRSDSTSVGTFPLRNGASDDAPTLEGVKVEAHQSAEGKLFLLTSNSSDIFDPNASERTLWTVDPATGRAQTIATFQSAASDESALLDGVFYFVAQSSYKRGQELWRSDGTSGGTYMLNDLAVGRGSSSPQDLTAFNGQIFFSALLDDGSRQLLATDGTSRGTRIVLRLETRPVVPAFGEPSPDGPHILATAGSKLLFTINPSGSTQTELIATEGQAKGSEVILRGDGIWRMTQVGDRPIVQVDGTIYGTDGTRPGTQLLHDELWSFRFLWNGKAYFFKGFGDQKRTFYISDGTRAGTRKANAPFDDFGDVGYGWQIGAGLLFRPVESSNTGRDNIWYYTNGSAADTRFIDIGEPSYLSGGAFLTGASRLYYAANGYFYGEDKPLKYFVPNTGNIAGTVFADLDSNGARDDTDYGLSGYKIFLDVNGDGICNKKEKWTRANRTGRYRFDCVPAGKYTVRIVGVVGRHATTPEGYRITVTPEGSITKNFGRAPDAMITGVIYHDANLNYALDLPDEAQPIWGVFIDFDNDNTIDPEDYVETTDNQGRYWFEPLPAGNYTLRDFAIDQYYRGVGTHSVRTVTLPPVAVQIVNFRETQL